MSFALIGVDPGFATFGWSVCEVGDGKLLLKSMGLIETKKSNKKLKVLASSDNLRRARELYVQLNKVVKKVRSEYGKIAFAAESQSWPRNAGSSAKVGMGWGVLACVAAGDPVEQVSPQALKKHITGRSSASKDEIEAAVTKLFPLVPNILGGLPHGKWNHPVDSLAVSITALAQSEMLKFFV